MRVLLVHNSYGAHSGEEVVVDRQEQLLGGRGDAVMRFARSSHGLRYSRAAQVRAFFAAFGSRDVLDEFRRLLRSFQPDIVHVHNLYPWISPAILPVCREHGVPVVMTVHNYRLLCPNGLMFTHGEICERCATSGEHWCVLRNCEGQMGKSVGYASRNFVARQRRWYLDNVDRFAVLTGFQRDKLVAAGFPQDRIDLLPNTAEPPAHDASDSLGGQVGFVGRVSQEKGVSVLVDAMRGLGDIRCSVAGEFHRQPELPIDAPSNVAFLGMLDKQGLQAFYRDLRMIVAPSICYEGFPMAIVEAMAHGKPVIASRIGGIPEIVDDGVTGLLFEPGNADDLADKIRYLWDRPELCRQMGTAGREKVLREYSEDRYYERLMAIYEDAMASRQ